MFGLFRRSPTATRQYRMVRCWGGYEPQISYSAGMVKGLFWYPLNREGYWLEPDAFTHGNPTRRSVMSKDDAKRAVLRSRAINQEHIAA
jgi:hypothetical protein